MATNQQPHSNGILPLYRIASKYPFLSPGNDLKLWPAVHTSALLVLIDNKQF
jgi:hypothetical protein